VEPHPLQLERRLPPLGDLGIRRHGLGEFGDERSDHLSCGLTLHAQHLGEDVRGVGRGIGHRRHHRADCCIWESIGGNRQRRNCAGRPIPSQSLRRTHASAAFSINPFGFHEVMDTEFYRIKRLPPYVIAEVNAMRAAARASGRDIIDLGMGNPDLPPPQHVIDKLCEVAQKPDAHGYSQSKGIPGLRRAQANYYARRWGVEVDPETEVVVTLGSKEGLASLATAITAPGDTILAPNPSYPIHTFGFIIAGATIRSVPTTPDERYWESLDKAMRFTAPRPTVLVVNYPSNPTAEVVDLAFYQRLVDWAKENKVWVLSDLAYSELYYNGQPTPSILQAKGAKDVAVEFTSLSKTFSMAGWRIGFAVGNKTLIAALTRVKSYIDYGAFTPLQAAACAALNGPQDIVEKNRQLYHK